VPLVEADPPQRRPLRFGVISGSEPQPTAWLDFARRVEDSGVDVLLIRDHFTTGPFGPQLAPLSALAAAAAATSHLHVGTMVLSNDYRHPALLAHEAATLHAISGGRFELGLGAGWYQPEYQVTTNSGQPNNRSNVHYGQYLERRLLGVASLAITGARTARCPLRGAARFRACGRRRLQY
jgi:alkanesulfonate monooxygenase SsuD/methylene tetrahydromethanopterin reductase-like flavin-dependent oxidoreductase (luciferase family)